MALKVKNPKKNLADILIEKERLNESYDSSSAVSLKTLEETAEAEEPVNKISDENGEAAKDIEDSINGPTESMVNEQNTVIKVPEPVNPTPLPEQAVTINRVNQPIPSNAPAPVHYTPPVSSQQGYDVPPLQQPAYYTQAPEEEAGYRVPRAERKPWEEVEDYNPPRKKRGRPYQGYAENTHVQSIYVRNDLYEYIMINYVGHGRKHSSFNKFVNAAINNYLRNLDEER